MGAYISKDDLAGAVQMKLASVDQKKMREIARAVYEDRSLLAAFDHDPEAAARSINGFEVPKGFHLHIADDQNRFYPAEEYGLFGSDGNDDWSRVEIRAGYRTISLVMCGAPA
jgi:hypothetical protein